MFYCRFYRPARLTPEFNLSHRCRMSQPHCSRCFLLFGLHLRPLRTTYFHLYRRDSLSRCLNHPDIHAQPYCLYRRSMYPSWHTIRDGPYLPMRNCPRTRTRPLRLYRISMSQCRLCVIDMGRLRLLLHPARNFLARSIHYSSMSLHRSGNLDILPAQIASLADQERIPMPRHARLC